MPTYLFQDHIAIWPQSQWVGQWEVIFTLEFISVLLPEVMHSKKQIILFSRSYARRVLRCAAVPVSLKMHLLAGSPILVVLLLLLLGGTPCPTEWHSQSGRKPWRRGVSVWDGAKRGPSGGSVTLWAESVTFGFFFNETVCALCSAWYRKEGRKKTLFWACPMLLPMWLVRCTGLFVFQSK